MRLTVWGIILITVLMLLPISWRWRALSSGIATADWEMLFQSGHHAQAMNVLQQNWRQAQREHQPPEFQADILSNMAVIYHADSLNKWADACYRHAVNLYETHTLSYAGVVPYARTLNNWGELQAEEGQTVLAHQNFKKSLTILHPQDADYSRPLLNLARLYRNARDYGHADPLFLQALHLDRLHYGAASAQVINDQFGLAIAYARQGYKNKALAWLEDTEQLSVRLFGPTHPNTLQIQSFKRQLATNPKLSSAQ